MPPRAADRRASRGMSRPSAFDTQGPAHGDFAARCGLAVSAEDRAWLNELLRRGA